MRKRPESAYNKWNIYVVIWDTGVPVSQAIVEIVKTSTIPPISTKRTITSHLLTEHKKDHNTWRWESRYWIREAQKCGGVKQVNGPQHFTLNNRVSNINTLINDKKKKLHTQKGRILSQNMKDNISMNSTIAVSMNVRSWLDYKLGRHNLLVKNHYF